MLSFQINSFLFTDNPELGDEAEDEKSQVNDQDTAMELQNDSFESVHDAMSDPPGETDPHHSSQSVRIVNTNLSMPYLY